MHPQNSSEQIKKIVQERIPESNKVVSKTLLVFSAICLVFYAVFALGILKSKGSFITGALIVSPALFILFSVWCLCRKGNGRAFPYVFILLLSVFWLELELMSGYKCKLLLPILLLVSMRYYNKRFTLFTYSISVLALLSSVWCNAFLYKETGLIDLNLVQLYSNENLTLQGFLYNNIIGLEPSTSMLLKNGLILTFLPNLVFLSCITVLSLRFMKYNLMNILNLTELAAREANQKAELTDMKTKVMLSQMKPHFIYNTLSSIAQLCTEEPARAKSLTIDFANYLRSHLDTLNEKSLSVATFTQELSHIESYLNIELVRFEGTLHVAYDIQAEDFNLPELCIQPIVENAVKHGVCKKEDGGTVTIATKKDADGWRIIVSDDGVGFDPTKTPSDGKTHIGIENIQKRLALFGGTFTIESIPGTGTVATVFIPLKEGQQ